MAWKIFNRKGFKPKEVHANYRWYPSSNQGQFKFTAAGLRYIIEKLGDCPFEIETWVNIHEDNDAKKVAVSNETDGQWKIVGIPMREKRKMIKMAGAIYGKDLKELFGTKPRFYTITDLLKPFDVCMEEVEPNKIKLLRGGSRFRLDE